MQPDEMFVERFAEPVAHLRMESPMLERFAIAAVVLLPIERVQAGFYVQAPMTCQTEFRTGIKSCRTPIWDIGLDPNDRTFLSGQPVLCIKRQGDH